MLNTTLNYFDNIYHDKLEKTLGKCLMQPHSNTNSASRKLMLSPQQDQRFALYDSEVPIVSTGYENIFGENNSSFITSDREYVIIAKIPKFIDHPEHQYIAVLKDLNSPFYTVIERIHYHHNTENYGYINNNEYIDSKNIGDIIYSGDVIRKSTAYDENNNRQDGRNAITAYMSLGLDMEDGFIISESFAKKLDAPLINKIPVMINDNNISLNLMGDDNNYKSFPDINEYIKDGILYASRLEKKEECLFSQSVDRLRKTFISDDKYTTKGKVVDIDIYCNDPEKLYSNYYNSQLLKHYNNSMRYSTEIVNCLSDIVNNPNNMASYDLKKLFLLHQRILKKDTWTKDKKFNFCMLEFVVEERNQVQVGDKIADRYGGKGVIAAILPDDRMPRLETGEIVEVIIDSNSTVGRLNPGQLFEISTNFIGSRLLQYINMGINPPGEEAQMYLKFLEIVAPTQHKFIKDRFDNNMSDEEIGVYLNGIIESGDIYTCAEPISESLSLSKLELLYNEFPWIQPYKIIVPMEGSNGNVRYIHSRRKLVAGKKYYYRLKQYAKEKASATSLSATNIKGLNTKSRANKDYKSPYSSTPTTFGNMEHANMGHIQDIEVLIINLMLHSASPHGRKLAYTIYESSDPFHVDVNLDDKAKNRNVEILNAYLKGKGLTLEFYKIPKQLETAVLFNAVSFNKPYLQQAISWNLGEDQLETAILDYKNSEGLNHPIMYNAIRFRN